MRPPQMLFLLSAWALVLAASPSQAQWSPSGVPMCQNPCLGGQPFVIPDGRGGAFVAWRDSRQYSLTDDDVYLQRVTAEGLIATGWPVEGLPVAVLAQYQALSDLAPDGFGGALVVWLDNRNFPGTGAEPYVQRVLADGSIAPGWPANGMAACRAPDTQDWASIAADGTGGAYVAWEDQRAGYPERDVYAQHLTADGALAPGWPQNGLPMGVGPGYQAGSLLADCGAGVVVVAWIDWRNGRPDVYGQRLTADGSIALGWLANGIPLTTGRFLRAVVGDGTGGFYICTTVPPPSSGFDGEYWLQRFTSEGSPAPGWPAEGVRVCNAPDDRGGLRMEEDGAGGAFLCWYDYRPPYTGGEIYALRVLPNGSLAPGWPVNGLVVSDPANSALEYYPEMARDDAGGAYIVWTWQSSAGIFSNVQHLTESGQVAPSWPAYGLRTSTSSRQDDSRIARDERGGAIVVWSEASLSRHGVYAQRFVVDGPVATTISLVSAEASSDRVSLSWYEAGDRVPAMVYRSADGGEWIALERVSPDGDGFVRYEDRDVTPGIRYGYRLGVVENGVERPVGEVYVEVPLGTRFALKGVSPNPSYRDLNVTFSLAGNARATLELIDITGRRMKSVEVGSLGAGNHVMNLGRDAVLPAGVYLVRLTQGARSLTTRAVVVK